MARPRIPQGMVPLLSSYSIGYTSGPMRTDVSGGRARYALGYDRGTQVFNVSLLLSPLEFMVWTAFYTRIINQGTITFDMPLDSGFGPQDHACNIIPQSYGATRPSSRWVVTFQVEAESQAFDLSVADAESIVGLVGAYGEEISPLLKRLAIFATSDTKVLEF